MTAFTSLKLEGLAGDPVTPSVGEKRSTPRRRVLLAGKIAFGITTADCTIRDLSQSGARIHAPSVLGLPDEVYLLVMREGLVVRTRRVWAQFPSFGLKFVSAEPIDGSTGPQTAPLRQAWEKWLHSKGVGA